MCDTIAALPSETSSGTMLFGKNSDRERNEAQCVELKAGRVHHPHARVRCTYIDIPQARQTHDILLARPFWCWGAEMAANQHGVVIGNEGLHARSAAPVEPALTGMDLVRLGVERASTAAEAVEVLVHLLETHGQGGNCGHLMPAYYHNGFVVVDPGEGYVIESIGREWLLEKVKDLRALSNRYSIERPERQSEKLDDIVVSCGSQPDALQGYASLIVNPNREHIGYASARRAQANRLLAASRGRLSPLDFMRTLRNHCELEKDGWHPADSDTVTLCMHAGSSERPGQTVGSWVSEIGSTRAVHWVTATAAPCLSVFKPLFIDTPLPPMGLMPVGKFDRDSVWWQHERLHRGVLKGHFASRLAAIAPERDALEARFASRIRAVIFGTVEDRTRIVMQCWDEAAAAEARWNLYPQQAGIEPPRDYESAWDRHSRLADMPT